MPRVKMTPVTRAALWFLSAYLVLLFALLVVRFLKGMH